ncbi:MAG TPA: hypothetical protein VGC66_23365 [Pyrinomonadaceae bacterium]
MAYSVAGRTKEIGIRMARRDFPHGRGAPGLLRPGAAGDEGRSDGRAEVRLKIVLWVDL